MAARVVRTTLLASVSFCVACALAGACTQKPLPSRTLPPAPPAPGEPTVLPGEGEKSSRPGAEPPADARVEGSRTVDDAVVQALAASDRDPSDRALDDQRKPDRLLAFAGIRPGMRVAELAAGTGYTAELLARVVGPSGAVYAQNSPFILERFAKRPWEARLAKPALAQVVRLDREFDAPFPDDVRELDAVVMVLFYHDTVWFGTDRAAMNRAVLRALKPGGSYVVVDHSARAGEGVSQAKALHRIEESTVVAEARAAGFVLADSADFLRNAADARDWSASPSQAGERRGQSDRFVLRFVKPVHAE